jgi:hypothetical protein
MNTPITVAELKRRIKDWPETNHLGEPTEVWILTGPDVSSQCVAIELLNCRICDDGTTASDILLCPANWRE